MDRASYVVNGEAVGGEGDCILRNDGIHRRCRDALRTARYAAGRLLRKVVDEHVHILREVGP